MYGGRLTGAGRRPARVEGSGSDFLSVYDANLGTPSRYTNYRPDTRDRIPNASNNQGYDTLILTKLDFDIRNNARAHQTDEFDITDAQVYDRREFLVVRRGQPFNMKMIFNRPYDRERDEIRLVFQFGKRPLPSRGSYVEVKLSSAAIGDRNTWGAYIQSDDGDTLTLAVVTPATCAVGKWNLKLDIFNSERNNNETAYKYGYPIYVLFNPWCRDDQVYMEEESLLREYILNETGTLYMGNSKNISFLPWKFGQFSGNVLDCALYLLDEISGLPDHLRGDPVQVSRKISSLVNNFDNNGVIVGNWSGNYSNGTSPLNWTGSADILEEYYRTKTPVKYGQCLTFSAVVTTVCRALGLPARSITNFRSAHDTDGSITLDKYYNSNFEEIEGMTQDSVWNYHAWNDVWMARPDLPAGYGGWQAIDATPQETSGGVFCAGPVSVKAIKQGDVHLLYDGPFVFAEVNSDTVFWMVLPSGKLRIIKTVTDSVGKYISTKKPLVRTTTSVWQTGEDINREDITDQYKFREGSGAERAAVNRASRYSTIDYKHESTEKDVVFELSSNDNAFVGEPLNVRLRVNNTSERERTVNGKIKITTMYYTGIPYKEVFKANIQSTTLKGNVVKNLQIVLTAKDYLDKLMDHCFFNITCVCIIEETQQIYEDSAQVMLRKPRLSIEAPDSGTVGQKFEVQVSFDNPLPTTLTRCELRVEGPGHQRAGVYRLPDVQGSQKFRCMVRLTPERPGEKDIIVVFNSAQISSISASYPINIYR